MAAVNNRAYLFGGQNHEASNEVAMLSIKGLECEDMEYNEAEWRNIDYESYESIFGRQNHT